MNTYQDSYLQFYATPAPMTDLLAFLDRLEELPTDIPDLVKMLQGLVVHIFWAERYGLKLSDGRKEEVNLRPAARRFARLFELDPAPLTSARPLERKLVSNCRDFTLMLVALLRCQGKPARARCGFGTYFTPGHYEDHWVAEVWDGERWRWVDAQLDELQCQVLQLTFDPLDLPPGAFVTGGQAWQLCRAGKADPDTFGIFQWKGWDFIRGDLFRDLLAHDRFEILPWDFWPALEKPLEKSPKSAWETVDKLARLEVYSQSDLEALQAALKEHRLFPPVEWAG
jgi:hypothetical protein